MIVISASRKDFLSRESELSADFVNYPGKTGVHLGVQVQVQVQIEIEIEIILVTAA